MSLAARTLREAAPDSSAEAHEQGPSTVLGTGPSTVRGGPSTLQGASPSLSERRATYAFRLAVSRGPRPEELARILAAYAEQLERFRRDRDAAVRVIGDYAVDGVDISEQAAWTLVANALLNLDETVTKE
jgi:hypothetical protein